MRSEEESTMSEPKPRTLGAVLYEDFELLDLYGPLEMFGSIGAGLRIVTVAEKTGPVASFQRPKTVAEFDFAKRRSWISSFCRGLRHDPAARESRDARFLAPASGDG